MDPISRFDLRMTSTKTVFANSRLVLMKPEVLKMHLFLYRLFILASLLPHSLVIIIKGETYFVYSDQPSWAHAIFIATIRNFLKAN